MAGWSFNRRKDSSTTPEFATDILPPQAWWFTLGQFLLGLGIVVALSYYFGSQVVNLVAYMARNENYSSGLLVPVVIAYIIYKKWEALSRPWRPSWWGLVVLAAGFGVFFLGAVLTIEYISRLALVLILAGLLWLLGGWRVVRLLGFPLLLLFLVIPLPQFFISKLTLRMQLVSTQLAAGFLRFMGYTVGLYGNIIDLGERQLQVVVACSGLGYLFNALGLGIIFCYFFQRRLWKAAVLLLAMVPFAIVANASRLATIAIWPIFEKGIWHTAFGLSLFIVGFDYLRGLNWVLEKLQPSKAQNSNPPALASEGGDNPTANSLSRSRFSFYPYLAAGLALVLVVGPLAVAGVEAIPVPLKQDFRYFPLQLGSWQGRHVPIEPELVAATGADKVLNAEFVNQELGPPVLLWIAYYENQKTGASVHSPNTCLTGSGWKTVQSQVIEVAPNQRVNFAILEQAGNRMAMYFWYYERGRWIASDYGHKLSIAYDRLVNRRADGALVRLTTPVSGNLPQAKARLDGLLQYLTKVLPEFIREEH